MEKKSVYIAGHFPARKRLQLMGKVMKKEGFDIVSPWLTKAGGMCAATASRDLQAVSVADWFILDTLDEDKTGGREAELGIALLVREAQASYGSPTDPSRQITIIGPRRNVFHELVTDIYPSWEKFFFKEFGLTL